MADSSRLAGRIYLPDIGEEGKVLFKSSNGKSLTLKPENVLRFLVYDPKTGKLNHEVQTLVTSSGRKDFFYVPEYLEGNAAFYTDLKGGHWFRSSEMNYLEPLPVEVSAYQAFVQQIPSFRPPRISAGNPYSNKGKNMERLAFYLEGRSRRFPGLSMQVKLSSGSLSRADLTDMGLTEPFFISIQPNDLSINYTLRTPSTLSARYINLDYSITLPLSKNGMFDVSFTLGYGFQEITGFESFSQDPLFLVSEIRANYSGSAQWARTGFTMNYRFPANNFFPYLGAGFFVETPFQQINRLDNFILVDNSIQTYTTEVTGFYPTISFPMLELGVEYPVAKTFWLGLALQGGLQWSVVENTAPFFGVSGSINY